jgi:DNA-binding SARP family transcriptional activator
VTDVQIPADLKPADGRFGCGPSKVRPEQLARLAELEQYDVDIQRALIALLLRRGRRAEAVRRYEIFRHRHRKAFAEDPDFDLADVAAEVNAV